jgi:hypothetical protein
LVGRAKKLSERRPRRHRWLLRGDYDRAVLIAKNKKPVVARYWPTYCENGQMTAPLCSFICKAHLNMQRFL